MSLVFGFNSPFGCFDKVSNNLYRTCYWYHIKKHILYTKKLLNTTNNLESNTNEKHIELEQVISVVYNHLWIET